MTLPVIWSAQARRQLLASLAHIADENPLAAELVFKRVEKSLRTLSEFPDLGSPAPCGGCGGLTRFPKRGTALTTGL